MADTVGVFIDYENVHRTAHGLFSGQGSNRYDTIVDPLKLAERLVAKRPRASTLGGVWVFRAPMRHHSVDVSCQHLDDVMAIVSWRSV